MATERLTPHSEHLKLCLLRSRRSAPLVLLAFVWCWLLPSESRAQLPLNPAQSPAIHLESFLGVDFGSSLEDAEKLYPTGLEETSPLGYPCYHVTGPASGRIQYSDVVYQFDERGRMQVVFAKFTPSFDEAVLEQLRRALGEPAQHTINADRQIAAALWPTSAGGIVHYDRSWHLFIMMGAFDNPLTQDVDLRLANYFE
ncbi:MAG: hypothetical protein ACLQU2_26780 [Candidatus Binataceae bacterium]